MTASIACPAKDGVDGGLVHEVHVVELGGFAAELGEAPQGLFAGIHQVVYHHHIVAGFLQGQHGVRTDVTGAASNQNSHVSQAIPRPAPSYGGRPCRGRCAPPSFGHIGAKKD